MDEKSEKSFSADFIADHPEKENAEWTADIEETDSKYFSYSINKKGKVIIEGFIGNQSTVRIPSMIDGHPVTAIAKGAFQDNLSLQFLYMPDIITEMKNKVFRNCMNLREVRLSNGLKDIMNDTFVKCKNLRKINIPDGVDRIKRDVLRWCHHLEELHIGKSLSQIDAWPFMWNYYEDEKFIYERKIRKIVIDPNNPYLVSDGSMILSKNRKTLLVYLGNDSTLVVPEGIESIGPWSCMNLPTLHHVVFPESLKRVEENAFSNTMLEAITLGSNVEFIDGHAFAFCSNLTVVEILNKKCRIDEDAFEYSPVTLPDKAHIIHRFYDDSL